jgi:hypothetical protein
MKMKAKAKATNREETNALICLYSQYSIDICEHEYILIGIGMVKKLGG